MLGWLLNLGACCDGALCCISLRFADPDDQVTDLRDLHGQRSASLKCRTTGINNVYFFFKTP